MKKYLLSIFFQFSFSSFLLSLLILSIPFRADAWWCPMNPSPQGNTLTAVWGNSENDVFAVGVGGTVIHYDGTNWSTMVSGTVHSLTDIWGSSSSDVFAVGNNGTILHYNGNRWSKMESGTVTYLRAVWGSSSSDVFAVGNNGTILHYNGNRWSVVKSEPSNSYPDTIYTDVWGSSRNDVFVVGGEFWPFSDAIDSVVYHYDGNNWSEMYFLGERGGAKSIWGSSGSDVFAILGSNVWVEKNSFYHYDGTSWSKMASGNENVAYKLWGRNGNDVFAVGVDGVILHYNGTIWSAAWSGANPLIGIGGSKVGDIFAVGFAGVILHTENCQDITPILPILLLDQEDKK